MDDGKVFYTGNGKFFASMDEAKKYADVNGLEILETRGGCDLVVPQRLLEHMKHYETRAE